MLDSPLRTEEVLETDTPHILQFLNEALHIYNACRKATYLKAYGIIGDGAYHNIVWMHSVTGSISSVGQYELCPLSAILTEVLYQ